MSGLSRDEIINALYEAGVIPPGYGGTENQFEAFHRFANLVAAAEREACANLCKGLAAWHSEIVTAAYENAADSIRARGNDAA